MVGIWRERRRRRDVARSLDTVLEDALRPARAFTARAPVRREQVADAEQEIEAVIGRLRDDAQHVDPAALVLAQRLLCEGDGPLFVAARPGALRSRVRLIRVALDGREPEAYRHDRAGPRSLPAR